jgi:hypothetical protein
MAHYCIHNFPWGMCVLFFFTLSGIPGKGNDAKGSIWQSYSAAISKPSATAQQSVPAAERRTMRQPYVAVGDPRYHAESFFGFPRRQDPMFDKNPKPSWEPMIENKPVYDRPEYTSPEYTAPHYNLDPVRKPTYERPLYTLPSDNKPSNNFKYVEAPGYLTPTYNAPVERAPNYVIRPIIRPAYDQKPTYDKETIFYNRPEYESPVYRPETYLKPREVAPPVIKPAE